MSENFFPEYSLLTVPSIKILSKSKINKNFVYESIFCHHRPELVYNHDLALRYPEFLLRHILLSGT